MASGPPGTPPLSPDGRSWWDGQGWQPLYTPDGMGRWNGHEWIPVVEPFGAPAGTPLSSVAAPAAAAAPAAVLPFAAPAAPVAEASPPDDVPSWLAQPPPGIPAPPPPIPEPEPAPPPAFGYAPPPRQGSRLFMYAGGLLLVGVLAVGGWAVRNQLQADGAANAAAASSPKPSGSDHVRADRFLNGKLGPSLAAATQTLPAFQSSCIPALPPSCRDAIATTDEKLRDTLAVIDHGDIPACIATSMTKFRGDIAEMDAGLQVSLGGYQDNNNQIIVQGFLRFAAAAKQVKADGDAVNTAEQSCAR